MTTGTSPLAYGTATAAPRLARAQLDLSGPFTPPRGLVERRLAEIWEQELQVTGIGVDDDYYELGGTSLHGIEIFLRIEQEFGTRLPLSALVEQPTIAHIARLIAGTGSAQAYGCLVELQPDGSRPPLFVIHDITANVLVYRQMVQHLDVSQPVFGLQYPDQDKVPVPGLSVEQMAARYVAEIRKVEPRGPYYLCGHSIGGMIIHEMALQLTAAGHRVALLANLDGGGPGYPARGVGKYFGHAVEFLYRDPRSWPDYLRTRVGYRMARRGEFDAADDAGEVTIERTALQVIATEIIPRAKEAYLPKSYAGSMQLFRCAEDVALWRRTPELGWRGLLRGGITIHDIPGTHQLMMNEPAVTSVAQVLQHCLEAAQARG